MASRAASHSEDCASTTPSRKRVVEPGAIAAAVEAEAQAASRRDQARDALVRDLEAARYGADRAFGQYDAIDPQNRLVAAELELRWNRALTRVSEIESRIAAHDAVTSQPSLLSPIHVAALAADLKAVWSAPATDARLKTRIVRTVIHEVVADIDDEASEIVLLIHWIGGRSYRTAPAEASPRTAQQHLCRHPRRRPPTGSHRQ